MEGARPIYKKLLIIAVVVYTISVTYMLSDIYHKIGQIEHSLCHTAH
ncbi:MAG: hypothetical protein WC515_04165 [Candidatus Omnitrophota bacterium]